jgi:hypothetical protein
MTTAIRRRRGTTVQHSTFTGLDGEVTVDTTKKTLVVHDGSTAGGMPLLPKTMSDGTANGVAYLNGSKVLTTGSALTFDGTTLVNTVADASTALKLAGATGKVRVRPYTDSTFGVIFDSTNAAESAYLPLSLFGSNIYSAADTAAIWRVAASEQMRLTSTGLGIGTSSPAYKLDAQTTATGTAAGDNTVGFFGSLASGRDANIRFGDSVNASARIGYLSGALYMYTNGAERLRLDLSGNLGIGTSSPGSFEGTVKTVIGGGAGSPILTLYGGNATYSGLYFADGVTGNEKYRGFFEYDHSTDALRIGTTGATKATLDSSGNLVGAGTTSIIYWEGVYNNTTASAANMFVASNGSFGRSTSALKYKQDIRDLEAVNVDLLRPVRYKSKCENDDQTKDHLGLIADEAADAGFEELVTRGEDGEVEGFQYERLTVVLLKEIQSLRQRVAQLEGA